MGLLAGDKVLMAFNANSAFAFIRNNPLGTPRRFASLVLVGDVAAIAWFTMALPR